MARIAGVTIPGNKCVETALTYIYGIGDTTAKKILKSAKIEGSIRVKDLTSEQENIIRTAVEKQYRVEGELRRTVLANVKRLKEVGCYRGTRHTKNLPCRGQRTRTNSRSVRGNTRRTAGSGRRLVSKT